MSPAARPKGPGDPLASHLEHAFILLGADVHSLEGQRRRLRPALGRLHLLGGHRRSARRWLREPGKRETGALAAGLSAGVWRRGFRGDHRDRALRSSRTSATRALAARGDSGSAEGRARERLVPPAAGEGRGGAARVGGGGELSRHGGLAGLGSSGFGRLLG